MRHGDKDRSTFYDFSNDKIYPAASKRCNEMKSLIRINNIP